MSEEDMQLETQAESERSEDKTFFWIIGALLLVAVILIATELLKSDDVAQGEAATFAKPVEQAVVVAEPVVVDVPVAVIEPVVVEPEVVVEPKIEVVEPEVVIPKPVIVVAPQVEAPTFDLVRVDRDGAAVIAGKAAANTQVRLMADGQEIGVTYAGGDGTFAFVTSMPEGTDPMQLQLEEVGDEVVKSIETVLVMPSPVGEEVAPKVVIAEASGDVVVQEQGELGPKVQALSLETINYSATGDVVFAGRGTSDQAVRVYVDNKPVVLGAVDDGNWRFEVPNIKEGIYTVRVDAVDDTGKVVDRVESPFQRVIAEMSEGEVTIQPGFTLWQLAELKYGSGDRYIQIFEANRGTISDPNMIFPGQIFEVPEE
jgi:nucleoid-associated protein YgaU